MGRPKLNPETVGVLDERRKPDGRRRIKLLKSERAAIEKQRLIESAVVLFLDLETHRKWPEIAQELGISLEKLKDLTKSTEFEEAYDRMLNDISHDPRYKAVQAGLIDLLPKAVKTLESLLTTAPPTVKLQAVQTVLKATGMQVKPPEKQDDRSELVEFLTKKSIDINLNVSLPADYAAAMQQYDVEGEYEVKGPLSLAPGEASQEPTDTQGDAS